MFVYDWEYKRFKVVYNRWWRHLPLNSFFSILLHKYVKVKTYFGPVEGLLKGIDNGFHGPLGTLILETDGQRFIIRKWEVIKLAE